MPRMTDKQESLFNAELQDTERMTDLELELELRYRVSSGEHRTDRMDAIHAERARRKEVR